MERKSAPVDACSSYIIIYNIQTASIQDYIMLPGENDFDIKLLHLTSFKWFI